jgi:hypothetical protein
VKSNLNGILVVWCHRHQAGKIYNESAYRLDKRIVLVPDLSVLRGERLKLGVEERFRGDQTWLSKLYLRNPPTVCKLKSGYTSNTEARVLGRSFQETV